MTLDDLRACARALEVLDYVAAVREAWPTGAQGVRREMAFGGIRVSPPGPYHDVAMAALEDTAREVLVMHGVEMPNA